MKKQNKSDVEIMSEMVSRNLDIKCTVELVQAQLKKKGGEITFGVDKETYSQISKGAVLKLTHHSIAFFINKKQYEEIRDRKLTGLELVKKERLEHFTKHNRTVEKDVAENTEGQLIMGATAILGRGVIGNFPVEWDEAICEKMANKPYEERLIIAASLIIAEIDRVRFEK